MDKVSAATVSGRELRCQHCSYQRFIHRTAQLTHLVWGGLVEASGLSGHPATIYVCARCGYAHFFMEVPQAVGEAEFPPQPQESADLRAFLEASRELREDPDDFNS
jgi:DNA-directed RNA polymerase subunit RPC12/RpoP